MLHYLERVWRRLRWTVRRAAAEQEIREEFRLHIEEEIGHLMAARGLTRAEASRAAHVAFGGLSRYETLARDARGMRALEEFVRDLRQGLRLLARNPVFAAVAILTLALGAGAASGIFSVLNRVVWQPLPYEGADRIVAVRHETVDGVEVKGISVVAYHEYRRRGSAIETLAVYHEQALNLADEEGARRIQVTSATPELFGILGVRPVLGRLYDESDWTGSSMDLNWTIPVLLSHDLWQSRFGGDTTVLGAILSINDAPRRVVGVLPQGFAFPRPETQVWRMDVPPEPMAGAVMVAEYRAIGRLRAGATIAEAQAEYATILAGIEAEWAGLVPGRVPETAVVRPLKAELLGDAARILWIIFASVLLLLLVAGANVANLFAVRAEARAREVAVRTALGAGRLSLARLFLAESLIVSAAGAAIGLLLAWWTVRYVAVMAAAQLPRADEIRLDGATLLFAITVTIVVSLLLGALALLRHVRRSDLAPALRAATGSAGSGRAQKRLVNGLIAAQVALTLALLTGSALLLRSYQRLTTVDRGFVAEGVLTVEVGVPFRLATRHQQLYDAIAERMQAIPGVTAVGGISALPLTGGGAEHPIRRADTHAADNDGERTVAFRFVLPGYFDALRTPVLHGYGAAPGETTEHPYPVVISDALARRLFPDGRAIGRTLVRLDARGDPIAMFDPVTRARVSVPAYTVAGIVSNMMDDALQAAIDEVLYVPVLTPRVEQSIMPVEMAFVLRTALPHATIAPAVRRAVHAVDVSISVARIRSLDGIVAAATARERLLAIILLLAAATALLLGAVGIYGTAAWTARGRAPEIGLRIALGAGPVAVVWMVLRQSITVAAIGAGAGLAISVAGTRVLRALLYEVSPTDPVILGTVTALIVVVAFAAGLPPALRAARIDPAVTLRAD